MDSWYSKRASVFDSKTSKSILHPFTVNKHRGNTINLYQGCQHRCGYCYATYKWSPDFYDKIYAKINVHEILENQLRVLEIRGHGTCYDFLSFRCIPTGRTQI